MVFALQHHGSFLFLELAASSDKITTPRGTLLPRRGPTEISRSWHALLVIAANNNAQQVGMFAKTTRCAKIAFFFVCKDFILKTHEQILQIVQPSPRCIAKTDDKDCHVFRIASHASERHHVIYAPEQNHYTRHAMERSYSSPVRSGTDGTHRRPSWPTQDSPKFGR